MFTPLELVSDIAGKVLDRLFPDPDKKQAAMLELAKLQQSGELQVIAGQIELDKLEATSKSLFVSGWRPAVGWVCVCGLGYQFVLRPLASGIFDACGHPVVFPVLEMDVLISMLVALLGVGGMRTVEKLNGVASK